MIAGLSSGVFAFPSFHPTNCANCHGNRPIQTTPASGGTITFGNNGNTLVGQTSSASFTIKNNHVNDLSAPSSAVKKGGGFTGSFPSVPAGTEFGPTSTLAIVGTDSVVGGPDYLTPQQSNSRNYTYTPQQRSLGVFDTTRISFTPTNGFSGTPPTVTITLRGKEVAPQISLVTTSANAGNILLGQSGRLI